MKKYINCDCGIFDMDVFKSLTCSFSSNINITFEKKIVIIYLDTCSFEKFIQIFIKFLKTDDWIIFDVESTIKENEFEIFKPDK